MDPKSGKVFLPSTIEQFTAQKKKNSKPGNLIKSLIQTELMQRQSKLIASHRQQEQQLSEDINNTDSTNITEKIIFSEYKKMFDEFHSSRYDNIKVKMGMQLEKLKISVPIKIPTVGDILNNLEIQSEQNINAIRRQLIIAPGKRNVSKLEQMLSFNKFFIILNKQKRWKIFQNSTFQQFQPCQKIYQEGDGDDYMYVIIKGCVKQYEKKMTSYNINIVVNFTSHYEGSNFGQVHAYVDNQKKGKRNHTTQATQKCFLLKISNHFYRELISNTTQDDFDKKLNALMESNIFRQTSTIMVMPLMSTLEKHILSYGKVLIRQEDEVRNIYFVAQGNLKVIYLDRVKRNINHLNIQQKPDNFYINKPKTRDTSRSKTKSYSIHNSFYYPESQTMTKEFIYGKKKLIGDQLQYNDHIVFSQLRVGDFFGGKSFLSDLEKDRKRQHSSYFDNSLISKLSIISSSTQSMVYSIDQKRFFSLSDNLQKLIIKGIIDSPYFDQYNIEQKLNIQHDWKKYTQKLVQNVIKGKKQRNHSFRN